MLSARIGECRDAISFHESRLAVYEAERERLRDLERKL